MGLAATAIRAGQHRTALVFGIEKMPKGVIRSSFFEPWREQAERERSTGLESHLAQHPDALEHGRAVGPARGRYIRRPA